MTQALSQMHASHLCCSLLYSERRRRSGEEGEVRGREVGGAGRGGGWRKGEKAGRREGEPSWKH